MSKLSETVGFKVWAVASNLMLGCWSAYCASPWLAMLLGICTGLSAANAARALEPESRR